MHCASLRTLYNCSVVFYTCRHVPTWTSTLRAGCRARLEVDWWHAMRRLLGQGEMHYSCVRPRVVGGVAPSIPRVLMQTHWANVACVTAQHAPSVRRYLRSAGLARWHWEQRPASADDVFRAVSEKSRQPRSAAVCRLQHDAAKVAFLG